jgi:hypothetical protein
MPPCAIGLARSGCAQRRDSGTGGANEEEQQMTTKPKTRKASAAPSDPIFAAIAEHKAAIKEYIRCRNNSERARAQAEKKYGMSLEGKALYIAAAEDTRPEYDQFVRAERAAHKAALRMARTTPMTLAGAAALITHTRREMTTEDWQKDWVPVALKTVGAAVARMAA